MRDAWRQCVLVFSLLAALVAAPSVMANPAEQPDQGAASDDPIYPERRKPQFFKDFGYAVFPYPYSLPGIGSGLSLVGGAMNIADTYTDVYGIVFSGDVKGQALGVADIHLIPRTLILDVGYGRLSRATIQSYSQRGMESGKRDYRLLELGDTEYYGGRLTATFFDRRFEAYGAWYLGASRLNSIRDSDGNVIVEAQDAPRNRGHTAILGTRLDLTDDYADPRRGIRFDVTRTASPPQGTAANYYVMDYSTTAYLPLGKRSTWAFNFLKSDAVVIHEGETDPAVIQQQLGVNCSALTDPTQQTYCNEVIANIVAQNKYGTATQLGGFNRLRGYPQGRYQGSHTLFFGTEIRWNLSDEPKPFDIFIMKDVRTLLQLAFFYETGVTSDVRSDLTNTDKLRDSYGVGLRVVTASGVVFRGDLGYGRDGFGAAVFIGYPWELQ